MDTAHASRYPARSSVNTRRDYSPVVLRKVPDLCLSKESVGHTDAAEDALMLHANPVSVGAFLPEGASSFNL